MYARNELHNDIIVTPERNKYFNRGQWVDGFDFDKQTVRPKELSKIGEVSLQLPTLNNKI